MAKLLFMLAIVFTVLTFIGAGYVLVSGGMADAGYAVVPMVLGLACHTARRYYKNN